MNGPGRQARPPSPASRVLPPEGEDLALFAILPPLGEGDREAVEGASLGAKPDAQVLDIGQG